MPVKHIFSISLENRYIGKTSQIKGGFVIICEDEKEIFNVKAFTTWEDVKNYENNINNY